MTASKRTLEEASHDDHRGGGDNGASASPADHGTVKSSSLINSPPLGPTSSTASGSAAAASSFRNVSACNRCRLRKNRCDQELPACASCKKARVKCVGYDPITKREIPRSYVYYLETRTSYLERLLEENGISYVSAEQFNPSTDDPRSHDSASHRKQLSNGKKPDAQSSGGAENTAKEQDEKYDREKLSKLVSNIGMVSVQGASDPRFLGSTSGISFARVVFAAVKSTVSGTSSERGGARSTKSISGGTAGGGTTMRDSFFGLHTKPTIKPAPFPDRELATKLVDLYFEHANPQIPILHRGEFMTMFNRVYSGDDRPRMARESYMLNIVFAIGAGIIMGSSECGSPNESEDNTDMKPPESPRTTKRRRLAAVQHQPEEYHASAIVHLESFLGSSPVNDRPDGFGGGLEELQAVLLLAGFALLRPVAPGLWYIVGVAVRLGVDLGLHYEDGLGLDNPVIETGAGSRKPSDDSTGSNSAAKVDAKERGRRQWVRDLRRRLWWCVYSFDRLVSTCVGRPFGITDQVITTEFPSLLDDSYITKEGFLSPPGGSNKPSYKYVAHHYFRLRLLQSEILQVLQHRQAMQVRAGGTNQSNEFMHTNLPSPFLADFDSFRSWRVDIDRRLYEWKESAPVQTDTGVQFSPLFLDLNYWQAVIMLYRQSLITPSALATELGDTNGDVSSPSTLMEDREDEDMVYLKVAEAGQKVLKLYRQLHRVHLVNYTFLATHHLFMAGISFLYAIWHSVSVRSQLSLDDVDFTVLAATSVLGDLIEKCPPAEACRDAFDRMSKATIQMCMTTTGFGAQALHALPRATYQQQQMQTLPSPSISASAHPPLDNSSDIEMTDPSAYQSGDVAAGYMQPASTSMRAPPTSRFDMNLRDLFSEEETSIRSFGRISNQIQLGRSQPLGLHQHFRRTPQHRFQQQQQQTQNMKTDPSLSPTGIRTQNPTHPPTAPSNVFNPNDPSINPPTGNLIPSPQLSPYEQQYTGFPAQQQQQMSNYPDYSTFDPLAFLDGFATSSGMHQTSLSQNTPQPQGTVQDQQESSDAPSPPTHPGSGVSGSTGVGGLQGDVGGGATSGLDLGFGMGFDGNHDWSEGLGVDLFEGFFFGGQ